MKRIWVAVFALIFVTALCFTERRSSNNVTEEITNYLDYSVNLIENNDFEQAEFFEDKIQDTWDKKEAILFIFTPHDRFNTFETEIQSLNSMLKTKQYEEYIVNAKNASKNLSHINESENLKVQNIL